MGIFDRFRRVFKSNVNAMLSKAEDPERMLNQAITEMNTQLIESKKSVASAIADEKRLERQMRQHQELAVEWEEKAVAFVKAGKDDSAKEALLRKRDLLNTAEQFKKQVDSQHEAVDKLKQALKQLQDKMEESIRKKSLLIARAKRAKAQQDIQKHLTSMENTSAFKAFEDMASKVEQLEAETEALEEVSAMNSGIDPLEEEYRALEAKADNQGADKLLEDLKKKMENEIEAPRNKDEVPD